MLTSCKHNFFTGTLFHVDRCAKRNAKASTPSTTSQRLLWRPPPSMTWLRSAPSATPRRSSRNGGLAFHSTASRTTSAPGTGTPRMLALAAVRETARVRFCTATLLALMPARPTSPCRRGSKKRACNPSNKQLIKRLTAVGEYSSLLAYLRRFPHKNWHMEGSRFCSRADSGLVGASI
jgi:hypothetical protein